MSISLPTSASPAPAVDQTPSFLIGRDGEGRWVAVEVHGLGGGLFRTRDGAEHYARGECRDRPGAVRLAAGPLALLSA